MSEPLDITRPLWQLYLIEGLEGGRHAIVSKTHHALVDGVAAVDVGTLILDPNPERHRDRAARAARGGRDEPSPEMLFVRAARERCARRCAPRGGRRGQTLTMPVETAGRVTAHGRGVRRASPPAGRRRPAELAQRHDRPRPPRRLGADATSRPLKGAARPTGATVNDVVLSVAVGGAARASSRAAGTPCPSTWSPWCR